jgi:hypothetical protein
MEARLKISNKFASVEAYGTENGSLVMEYYKRTWQAKEPGAPVIWENDKLLGFIIIDGESLKRMISFFQNELKEIEARKAEDDGEGTGVPHTGTARFNLS